MTGSETTWSPTRAERMVRLTTQNKSFHILSGSPSREVEGTGVEGSSVGVEGPTNSKYDSEEDGAVG